MLITYIFGWFTQHNMLIRPTPEQLADFGEPDFIVYNAGQFTADGLMKRSATAVDINFKRMEMVILGTEYAGEMKKGIFSVMVGLLSCPALSYRSFLFEALSATRQIWPTLSPCFRQCRR